MFDFVLKMLDFVLKMLDFVLKMLDFAGGKPDGGFLWDLLRLLRTRADKLMAARDHDWESWFAEDTPELKTGSTSPFNYTAKAAANGGQGDPTGLPHLLRHGVDIGQAFKTGPLWWRVDGLQVNLDTI